MNDRSTNRSDWNIEPIVLPTPIPAPTRVWTGEEMEAMRRGLDADRTLRSNRSWSR